VGQLAGPVGRAVAAVAVIFLGFSLFMGKVTWGLALALGIGIAAIFGAPEIVDMLGGDGEACPEL
jgi:type IV secretion system protein VirB2